VLSERKGRVSPDTGFHVRFYVIKSVLYEGSLMVYKMFDIVMPEDILQMMLKLLLYKAY
jgi:hypothetical protein